VHDSQELDNVLDPERSRVRVRIEHVLGHIETAMHGCYVSTIGIARARAKIGLEVLAYNMSRFTFLMRSRGTTAPA
jgi:IS5 family transposase